MEKKNQKFRWRYFIDKPFQLRFIGRFSLLIIFGLVISLIVIAIANLKRYDAPLYFKAKKIDTTKPLPSDPNRALLESIDFSKPLNSFELYWKPLVLISILYLLLIAIFGLFISHKMAGPVYRIKKTLQDAADGKIDIKELEFKLRKRDELQDLVEALNKFLDHISDKLK